jgi:hypothetical protein
VSALGPRIVTIATAPFSIGAGKTATVRVALDRVGRALMGTDHGRLRVHLTVFQSAPAAHTQIRDVRLTWDVKGNDQTISVARRSRTRG